MSTQRFQGKIALVTGGNSGIGLANAVAVQADVSKLLDIERAVAEAVKVGGRIDVLFVNAGIGHFAPIEQSDEAFFDRQFATNVKGAYFTIQKALPHMREGSSIVINASSVVNLGLPNSSVYTATKAAIASLARSLALELSPRGIRLNVVNPGPIETPIFGRMGLDAEATKALAAQITASVPMKRFGSPEEVARAVLFLASDEASFVHGTSLGVDGGMASL